MIAITVKNNDMEFTTQLPVHADAKDELFYNLKQYANRGAHYEILLGRFGVQLDCKVYEKDNWHELNYAAYLLDHLDHDEAEKLEAIWYGWGEQDKSIAQMINLIFRLKHYNFNPDIDSEEDWAKQWLIEEAAADGYGHLSMGLLDWLEQYIDYSQIWLDQSPEEGIITEQGYLEMPEEADAIYPMSVQRVGYEVDTNDLVAQQISILKERIKGSEYPTFTPDTAWYVLYGFKLALKELGLLQDCQVPADTFYSK